MPGNVTKIGKYDVTGVIGQGGMGIVYKGIDARIGRAVAIKMMTSGFARNEDALRRFYREAQSVGVLQHPNIVTIYDLGDEDGTPYLVMEYLDGEALDKTIAARRELSAVEKLDIIIQTLKALQYAHQHKIVHRDVKPGNVIVLPDGNCKLVDFGIARGSDATLTHTGQIIGSMSYMSPEQLNGRDIDGRTDIWSAAVMLFELLTYHLPFEARETAAMIVKILNEPPPPLAQHLQGYPAELDEMLSRALAKDRNERYASADDFAFDLAHVQEMLKAQMVSEYVEHARSSMQQADLGRARELLSRVLKIDTQNATAKQMLYEVQQLLHREQRSSQVQALKVKAEEALNQSQWEQALALVDEGLRLDKTSLDLLGLREAVLQHKQRKEQVAKLLHLAEAARQAGELQMAKRAVDDALAIDANDTQAKVFSSTLVHAIEQQQRFEELLKSARNQLAASHFTQAAQIVREAEALKPQAPEVTALKSMITAGREEELRRERLQAARTEVEQALAAERFIQAQAKAEETLRSFPGNRDILALLEQAKTQQQNRWIEQQLAAADKLVSEQRITAAISLLQTASASFHDPRLQEYIPVLQQKAEQQKLAAAKSAAIAAAQQSLDRQDYGGAIAALKDARTELGPTTEIEQLLSTAQAAAEAARRNQAAEAVEHARRLLDLADFDGAEACLQEASVSGLTDPGIEQLLAHAQERRQQWRHEVDEVTHHADLLLRDGKVDEALALLAAQPQSYSHSSEFRSLTERARNEQTRQHALLAEVKNVRTALATGDAEGAWRSIQGLRNHYGDHPEIPGLLAEVESVRARQACESSDFKAPAAPAAQDAPEVGAGLAGVPQSVSSATVLLDAAGSLAQLAWEETPTEVALPPPPAPIPPTVEPILAPPEPLPPPAKPITVPHPPHAPLKLLVGAGAVLALVLAVALYVLLRPASAVSVRFEVDPTGAEVSINQEKCTAPCALKLKPGNYKLLAKREGYDPVEQQISVGTSPQTIALKLTAAQAPVGSVTVETNVDQADISVDGTLKGVTEGKKTTLALLPGSHEVRAEKSGYKPDVRRIQVGKDSQTRLVFTLEPGGEVQPPRDPYLIVKSRAGAKILVDKAVAGKVQADGSFSLQTKPGKHRVEISLTGYQPWSTTVTAKAGDSIPIVADLQEIPKPPPAVDSFTASAASIQQGHTSELRWQTHDATDVSIDPAIGAVQPNGSRQVSPAASTTYTLIAKGAGQTVQKTVTITVAAPPPVPKAQPSIMLFDSGVDKVQPGQPAKLSWATQNATDVSIDQGIGTVGATGWREVRPNKTTTYTLTAKGPGGSITKSVQIGVEAAPAPVVQPSPPPAPVENPDFKAIRDAIERYKDAYESMAIDELQRAWPTMTKPQKDAINSTFKAFKAIRAHYDCAQPTISGDSARCACTETVTYTTNDNKRQQPRNASIIFELKKNGAGWSIQNRRGQ